MTLAEFLLARIAEDEAIARAASPGPWHTDAESTEVQAIDDVAVADGFALSGPQLRATTAHIAHWDPARVLTECAAKRQIIARCAPLDDIQVRRQTRTLAHNALMSLALPYADHQDYAEEWRP